MTTFANSSIVTLAMGIAIDSSDNIYVTDLNRVLKFTSTGVMSVIAGSKVEGFVNAVGTTARFNFLRALAIGSDGNLYVADALNNCVRKVSLAKNEVTTYAGNCTTSVSTTLTDGPAANAVFYNPLAIAAAADNVFYVTDGMGKRLRKIYSV